MKRPITYTLMTYAGGNGSVGLTTYRCVLNDEERPSIDLDAARRVSYQLTEGENHYREYMLALSERHATPDWPAYAFPETEDDRTAKMFRELREKWAAEWAANKAMLEEMFKSGRTVIEHWRGGRTTHWNARTGSPHCHIEPHCYDTVYLSNHLENRHHGFGLYWSMPVNEDRPPQPCIQNYDWRQMSEGEK